MTSKYISELVKLSQREVQRLSKALLRDRRTRLGDSKDWSQFSGSQFLAESW